MICLFRAYHRQTQRGCTIDRRLGHIRLSSADGVEVIEADGSFDGWVNLTLGLCFEENALDSLFGNEVGLFLELFNKILAYLVNGIGRPGSEFVPHR